jgi:hypothetical protein
MSPGDVTEVSDSHAPKLMHISETQEQMAPVTLLHKQLLFKDFEDGEGYESTLNIFEAQPEFRKQFKGHFKS